MARRKITKVCVGCGQPFLHIPQTRPQKYCSRACFQAFIRTPRTYFSYICIGCGGEFKHRTRTQPRKYCSPECSHAPAFQTSVDRVRHVLQTFTDPAPCWLWRQSRTKGGYGRLFDPVTKTMVYAHRAAWEATHGPIEGDLHVLHRCDTPPCFNPNHLFLGSHAENMADMAKKGKHWRRQRALGALHESL